MILQILVTFIIIYFACMFMFFYTLNVVKKKLQKEIEVPKVWIETVMDRHFVYFGCFKQQFHITHTSDIVEAKIWKKMLEEMFEKQKQDTIDKI